MCDTILAPPGSTAGDVMLFGKNSDRQRNEAQLVECFPRADHKPDALLACTYITIPQARHTHAVLLCRPFWIWGAEMGANEHGVVIGNEGIQARSAAPEEKALVGMDLVRLALERAATAEEAVRVIADLLKQHGQGGNCGHLSPAYYNNSFMIADSADAFVMETVGREWVLERVRGVRAISNTYSIGREVESTSAGLAALIRDSGWSQGAQTSYADVIANPQSQHIGDSSVRRDRATSLLASRMGQLDVPSMARILRDHGSGNQPGSDWQPKNGGRTLCLHALAENFPAQTTGSMVSELHKTHCVHWVTGTAAPCLSVFKPVLMDAPLPFHGPRPTDRFDARTLWWRHERLHRRALMGSFAKTLDDIREERDALERNFYSRMKVALSGGDIAERSQVIAQCWEEAIQAEDRWYARMNSAPSAEDTPYRATWLKMNRLANVDNFG